jgi:hypothetical protein
MINKFNLAFILFLTPIISNCQNGDEYQVFTHQNVRSHGAGATRVMLN